MMINVLALENNIVGYLALVCVVVLVFFMLRNTSKRLREPGSSPKAYAREQIARLHDQKDLKGDMEELLLHLQELSRDINSQLDTKFVKLEASIRSADQRIEQLERLMQAAGDRPAVDMLVSDETSQSGLPQPSPMEETDPRKQRIYELADAGKTPLQIAQETGGGTGEIELILSLRGTSGRSG